MGDTRKLLLVGIIFTALYDKVTAVKELLDLAPSAVDIQYNGCREEALKKFIHSGLLRQELQRSERFQKAWIKSSNCSKLIPGGIKEHTTALRTYLDGDKGFLDEFNKAMETNLANESTYENDFHFKCLHFLIMDSLTLLKQQECKTVYLDLHGHYTLLLNLTGRLKGFTKIISSYSDIKEENDLYDITIFNITSCFFANLGENICFGENVTLLSPAEVFTVESVNKIKKRDDDYTEIVLKNAGVETTDNCHIFSRSPADVSAQWLVLMLVALSLFVFAEQK